MVVRRTHTTANVAPTLVVLGKQINGTYSGRDKTSDGIWPSAQHSAASPNSDHDVGNARDFDDDLSGVDGKGIEITPAFAALLSRHPSCNYTIHDRRIYRDGIGKPYTGTNPHIGHLHVSVYESKRNDTKPWTLTPPAKVYDTAYYWLDAEIPSASKAAFVADITKLGLKLVVRKGVGFASVSVHAGEKSLSAVHAALTRSGAVRLVQRNTNGGVNEKPDATVRRLNAPTTTTL